MFMYVKQSKVKVETTARCWNIGNDKELCERNGIDNDENSINTILSNPKR